MAGLDEKNSLENIKYLKTCGWRTKIGLIVPSNNSIIEPELYQIAPEGVTFHTSRLQVKNAPEMATEIDRAIKELSRTKVNIIVYCCLSSGLERQINGENDEILAEIERKSRIPATTASTAMLNGLLKLNIKKLSVASPYSERLNWLLRRFLEKRGFSVIRMKGLNLSIDEVCEQPPYVVYNLVKKVFTENIDGVLIASTDFGSINIIEILENELERPVISSNQAIFWDALRKVGVHEIINGYGRLLKEP